MLHNISILDDVDTILDLGDDLIDPFNLLKVESIKANDGFLSFIKNINVEKLFNETPYFDMEKYQFLSNNTFIEDNLKEIILRFAHFVCEELILNPNIRKINISHLLNNSKKLLNINIYIYHEANNYVLNIKLKDKSVITIKFKNTTALTIT